MELHLGGLKWYLEPGRKPCKAMMEEHPTGWTIFEQANFQTLWKTKDSQEKDVYMITKDRDGAPVKPIEYIILINNFKVNFNSFFYSLDVARNVLKLPARDIRIKYYKTNNWSLEHHKDDQGKTYYKIIKPTKLEGNESDGMGNNSEKKQYVLMAE